MKTRSYLCFLAALALAARAGAVSPGDGGAGPSPNTGVPISDITTISGVRDNLLVGYGLVVGLNGTGDRQQTLFTTQTLGNILQRMGVQINPQAITVNNVAAVFVTATLPPFARPGMHIDVSVSSTGDARSLSGGLLLLSSLHGPDGNTYAEAQGAVTVGALSATRVSSGPGVNQNNVGLVPAGGIVERDTAVDLRQFHQLSLLLREPGFVTAQSIAAAINQALGATLAHPVDSRQVDVAFPPNQAPDAFPDFAAKIEAIRVGVTPPARVVADERTGTIVIGNNAHLSPVSILHGSLAIEIASATPASTAPKPASAAPSGDSSSDPQSVHISLPADATVQDLVNSLQAIGASAREIVAILRAVKAAGALQAELEVI